MNSETRIMAKIQLDDLPKRKKVWMAILLAVVFGWIGVLYANWRWAITGFVSVLIAMVVIQASATPSPQMAVSLLMLVSWIASIMAGYQGAIQRNDKITAKRHKLQAIIMRSGERMA